MSQDTSFGPDGESVWYVQEADPAVRAQIIQAYREVWDEFYEWEQETCEAEIMSLASNPSPEDNRSSFLLSLQGEDTSSLDFEVAQPVESSDDAMEVDSSGSSSETFTIHDFERHAASTVVCVEKRLKYHRAYSKYYACTPTNCNVAQIKDPKVARFVPFDGEPRFSENQYVGMKQWNSLAWQDSWVDPDGISLLSSQNI